MPGGVGYLPQKLTHLGIEQYVTNALKDIQTEPVEGGVEIDIVTRQAVFVRQCTYDSLEAHCEAEGYDVATYKMHSLFSSCFILRRV